MEYTEGQRIQMADGDTCEIMAVRGIWVMARRFGCIPFVKSKSDMQEFLNDKRNVARGEEKSSCQHKFEKENPHFTRCLKCGKKWTLG